MEWRPGLPLDRGFAYCQRKGSLHSRWQGVAYFFFDDFAGVFAGPFAAEQL
jgi:hypothetical protein